MLPYVKTNVLNACIKNTGESVYSFMSAWVLALMVYPSEDLGEGKFQSFAKN